MGAIIFGAGFIGHRLHQGILHSTLFTSKLGSKEQILSILTRDRPDYVINAIGKSGNISIDWCEKNKDETFFANYQIPLFLSEACRELDLKLVNLGTGCFYSGTNNQKGFSEEDEPNFVSNTYLKSKFLCEQELLKFPNVLQLRLRLPIDVKPHRKNLISKVLAFDKIINVPNSVTYLPDLFLGIPYLLKKEIQGIVNFVSKEPEYHEMIIEEFSIHNSKDKKWEIMSFESYSKGLKALRSFCLLSTDKLQQAGFKTTPIREAIRNSHQAFYQGAGLPLKNDACST